MAVGAQCRGERHERTIARQREAVNELRVKVTSLEQLRPANSSHASALQQVVLLKRDLAELRARQALPADLHFLTMAPGLTSFEQRLGPLSNHSSVVTHASDTPVDAQTMLEERTAHAETTNVLQACDDMVDR